MRIVLSVILIMAAFHSCAYAQENSSSEKLSGFTAGPYLLDVTTDSAVVAFHLDTALMATVQILDGNDTREFKSESVSKSHFVKINGLKPGLTYTYEVICGDGQIRTPAGDQSFQIRTVCRPGESFTFAVYGDTRPSENKTTRYHQEVINQAILHEPLFALVLGDMVDDGSKSALWYEFFNVESKLLRRCAIYPVLGDTDYENGKGIYSQFFPELSRGYYKFEWGGVQFFAMKALGTRGDISSSEFDAESPQIKWLESELSKEEAQKAPFRVVFLHDPVFISRGRSSEVLRRVWAPLFQKYKVDVVFASWHLYERSTNEQVTYIISGGAGAELIWMNKDPSYPSQADAREYHFCRVDLNSNAMTISAIAADGTVLDSITLTPKSNDVETSGRLERAAKRLEKEIIINANSGGLELPVYFFSSDCDYCRNLLKNDLPKLAQKNNITLRVHYYDLGIEGTYDLFLNAATEFGRPGVDVPAIFIGRSVFGGESEIEKNLPAELTKFYEEPQTYLDNMITPFTKLLDTSTIKEKSFSSLTFGSVLGAGLMDGIRPCALTALIFLISYLYLFGDDRRRILITAGWFTLTVFISYFLIGAAFFNSVKGLLRDSPAAMIVNLILLVVAGGFAVFSLKDFVQCLRGNVSDIAVKPSIINKDFHEKIEYFIKNQIAVTAFSCVLGVILACIGMVCTGQLYLRIVTMISEPHYRITATSYLFTYNIMFVLPLIVLTGFLFLVFTSKRLSEFFRRRMALVKLGLTVMFVGMAIILIFNLRQIL